MGLLRIAARKLDGARGAKALKFMREGKFEALARLIEPIKMPALGQVTIRKNSIGIFVKCMLLITKDIMPEDHVLWKDADSIT